MEKLDGYRFARMVISGAANLKEHIMEINHINVFPVPDGDTGDNMLLTMMGGIKTKCDCEELCNASECIANGMLISAHGNSGVILSQFFEGIKIGFAGIHSADTSALMAAFRQGVSQAYSSVKTPTEGTILTVVKEATEYACTCNAQTPYDFLKAFVDEAKCSLAHTPELLPVLKMAGVVDSGAAGFVCIAEGMLNAFFEEDKACITTWGDESNILDFDAFGEDSVLEYGYCTELLLRLQNAKTNIASFDMNAFSEHLQSIGSSVVAVINWSIVKLHIHTMKPQMVLDYCQQYGEFLKVKIENMSLQHNDIALKKP